jgi:predicted proteasome-type protease
MGKNITIPQTLFYRIIDVLESWDVTEYAHSTQEDYFDVLFALLKKQQNMELRKAYAQINNADSETERHDARMKYLFEKREHYRRTTYDF